SERSFLLSEGRFMVGAQRRDLVGLHGRVLFGRSHDGHLFPSRSLFSANFSSGAPASRHAATSLAERLTTWPRTNTVLPCSGPVAARVVVAVFEGASVMSMAAAMASSETCAASAS